MQAPISALRALRRKYQNAVRAVDDSFQATKNLFEKHNVVFTVAGGLLSAGAAWAGYTARQVHQKKLEEKLQKIEEHMTNVYSLEEQQVKALTTAATRTGVSYKTFLATSSTALIVGYALGFRGGRRFVIRRIPPDLLRAAKKQKSGKQTGLARLLPGRLGTTNESSGATPSHSDAPASAWRPSTEPLSERPQANESKTPATAVFNDSGEAIEPSKPGRETVGESDDPPAEAPRSSGRREEGPEADRRPGEESSNAFQRHAARNPDLVDAALGLTTFERQVERVMRPEREAKAQSREDLDKVLQATIPNLHGESEAERKDSAGSEVSRSDSAHVESTSSSGSREGAEQTEPSDSPDEQKRP
ncbi:hypothetical protein KFL_000060840 [Klebsormidium nitens]|uniref:Uncharacterized protein n=1 Tax=Klebsormidium nitens TaxID=105231 RepID=A0A0U9HI39_KLENI|nr:hypothetical protein KFL_000060840 [Klebsormidium nitens]|eukprot:GAQ78017.1 hypothetical protein KFL_000060840 [Klebsormidium nitens]